VNRAHPQGGHSKFVFVAYEAFRVRELDESLLRATGKLPFEDSLVVNKSTVGFGVLAKGPRRDASSAF
jgi:hypothetical protein